MNFPSGAHNKRMFAGGGLHQQHLFHSASSLQLSRSPADMKEEAFHDLTFAWKSDSVHRPFDVPLHHDAVQAGRHTWQTDSGVHRALHDTFASQGLYRNSL